MTSNSRSGVPKHRVSVIPNAVDCDMFHPKFEDKDKANRFETYYFHEKSLWINIRGLHHVEIVVVAKLINFVSDSFNNVFNSWSEFNQKNLKLIVSVREKKLSWWSEVGLSIEKALTLWPRFCRGNYKMIVEKIEFIKQKEQVRFHSNSVLKVTKHVTLSILRLQNWFIWNNLNPLRSPGEVSSLIWSH